MIGKGLRESSGGPIFLPQRMWSFLPGDASGKARLLLTQLLPVLHGFGLSMEVWELTFLFARRNSVTLLDLLSFPYRVRDPASETTQVRDMIFRTYDS
jgi:hypothetical protein